MSESDDTTGGGEEGRSVMTRKHASQSSASYLIAGNSVKMTGPLFRSPKSIVIRKNIQKLY